MDDDATDIEGVSQVLMQLIRDNMFNGQELALIEPFNGPRPSVLYCSIGFVRARPYQHTIKRYETRQDGYYEILRGERFCQYRIRFFGKGAYQKAIDCQNWMKSILGAEFILAPITGFGAIGEVQETTTEYLGVQEERAFFNVDLYAKFSAEWKWTDIVHVLGNVYRNAVDLIPVKVDKE